MVSIVMATYNGTQFIRNQIDSILSQLNADDEFIVSDDGSTDGTFEVLQEYEAKDSRIKLFIGPKSGVIKNFEYALSKTNGEILFLADQDDMWFANKVQTIIEQFRYQPPEVLLILHNGIETGIDGLLLKSCYTMRHGIFKNILKSSYYGHRIAFRKELLAKILPFPNNCPSYDQYIGLVCELERCSVFIANKLTNHVIHGNNWSHDLSLLKKIGFRCMMGICLFRYLQKKVYL